MNNARLITSDFTGVFTSQLAALPLNEWQFWLTTTIAAAAVFAVIRPFLPAQRKKKTNCPGCPSGESAHAAKRPKRVDLTIEGKHTRR